MQFIGGTMFWIKFDILKKIFWSHNFDNIMSELNNENSFESKSYKSTRKFESFRKNK